MGRKPACRRRTAKRAEEKGGPGGRTPREPRSLLKLEEQALHQGWPLSKARRAKIISRLMDIVDPPEPEPSSTSAFSSATTEASTPASVVAQPRTKTRGVVSAARALMSAYRIDLEERKLQIAERLAAQDVSAAPRVDADLIERAERIHVERVQRLSQPSNPSTTEHDKQPAGPAGQNVEG